MVAEDN